MPGDGAVPATVYGLLREGKSRWLIGGLIFSAMNAALTLTFIAQIRTLIDSVGAPASTTALFGGTLLVSIFLSHVAAGALLGKFGTDAMARIRARLAAAVTAADYQHLEALGGHRVHAAFTEDVPRLMTAFGVIPAVLLNSIITSCGIAFLGTISPGNLLVVLGMILVGLLISELVLMRGVKRCSEKIRTSMDGMYKQIHALIFGTKELKLNGTRERYFRDRLFGSSVEELRKLSLRRERLSSAYFGWSASISLIMIGGSLWVGHYWVPMDRSQMIAFTLVLMYLRGPIISIVSNVPQLASTGVALRNIRRLNLPTRAPADHGGALALAPWKELVLEDVAYSYRSTIDARSFELQPVSVTLRRGEIVYITGGNGSGKSTLVKLLAGLYRPTSGTLRLDGRVIDDSSRDWYRSHFSAVFGDYFLFDRVLGPSGELVPDEEIRGALKRFELDGRVDVAGGVLTSLDLSQGQRKRLALIVALAEDRPVLLFDEWAAEQDAEFRHRFYCEILPALKAAGKTSIVITHDNQYFHTADRVLRVEQGRLRTEEPRIRTTQRSAELVLET